MRIRNVLPFSTALPNNATSSTVLLGYPVLSTSWIWQTASKFGQQKLVIKKQPGDLSQSDWEIFWMSINLWWRGKDSVAKIVQQQVCILWRGVAYLPYISIWDIFISNHLVVEMWVGTWDRLGQPTNQSNEIPRNCLCAWAKRLMLRRKATHRWNVIEANKYSVVLECGSSCTFSISKVQCVDLENKM